MTEQQRRRTRIDRRLRWLVKFLISERARGACEICRRPPDWRGFQGAHIERRARDGSNDTIWNIIIACGRCHDHYIHKSGLAVTKERAREIVQLRNQEYNIKWEETE